MANREFLFFYAPAWDYPPDGPIKLGNVLASIKKPHRPLSCSPPPPPRAGDPGIFRTEKRSVQYTKEKLRSGKFSVLTKFLSVLGIGVDVGAEVDNSDEESFTFDSVETIQFIPTQAYLQSCVEAGDVRSFLRASRYRKPVYVITGLKIVRGAASAHTRKSRTVGGALAVEVDATILSGGVVPVGGGPGVQGRWGDGTGTSWEGSGDFIFAFRVSRVFVGEVGRQDLFVREEEEYCKGAMLGWDPVSGGGGFPGGDLLFGQGEGGYRKFPVGEGWTEGPRGLEMAVVGVDEPDAEGEGFDQEELLEDGQVVLCALPR